MKRFRAIQGLLAPIITLLAGAAVADASRCYAIRDNDSRNACLAEARQQTSYCYSIRDADGRNLCLATVSGTRSYCYSIQAPDLRARCLARF